MAAEGYPGPSGNGKTFLYETGSDGRWDVVYMVGNHDASWYQVDGGYPGGEAFGEMLARLPASFHNNNVTVYMYDLDVVEGDHLLYTGQGGSGAPWEGDGAGYVLQGDHILGVGFDTVATCIRDQRPMFEQTDSSGLRDYNGDGVLGILTRGQYASTDIGASIHELGHAFYLGHLFTDYDGDGIETNLMGNGFRRFSGRYSVLGYLPATALGRDQAAELDSALLFNQSCPDADNDLICDAYDVCPGFHDDADNDCDGIPDGCGACPPTPENDTDTDGVCADLDNCLFDANFFQDDVDGDGSGDVCDNCPADANPTQTDGDSDGLGDACDPCTGPALVRKPKILVTKLETPPGDDKLTYNGEVTLPHPFNPPLDPLTNGVRLLIDDTAGNLLDLTIPGGAFVDPPAAGWKVNKKVPVSKWTYLNKNKTVAPPAGITKVVVQDSSLKTPGLVKFSATGKNGSYAPFSANLPLASLMVLDPPTAETGQCGALGFPGPVPSPACVFDPVTGKLKCK